MGFSDWCYETVARFHDDGIRSAARTSAYELYRGSWRILGSRFPAGTNVYDRDWDILVVLDACRTDELRRLRNRHPFLQDFNIINSVGSHSREWLAKTFSARRLDAVKETAYVTGNIFSRHTFTDEGDVVAKSPFSPDSWPTAADSDFLALEEVWREAWDDSVGTVPPRAVTDRAIATARTHSPTRLIIHYMQPHLPFIASDYGYECDFNDPELEMGSIDFPTLRRGEVTRADFLQGYRANLRLILDEVAFLRRNVDAEKMVITADHGEAIGEWGIYGHPIGFLHPVVKSVPWVETGATDMGEYTPAFDYTSPETDVSERLRALGYAD